MVDFKTGDIVECCKLGRGEILSVGIEHMDVKFENLEIHTYYTDGAATFFDPSQIYTLKKVDEK